MTEKTFPASDAALHEALDLVEQILTDAGCPMKTVLQITVCVEEMFVNVAHYAYGENGGDVTLAVGVEDGIASITLIDSGIPFDPLQAKEPDITLSAEERSIGGLGIFMVRKSMDEVSYERRDGQNRFTMKKKL